MPIHVYRVTQIVPAPLAECWAFFSDPRNLARITPPALEFRILSELPERMYPGMFIAYRVCPLRGIPMKWLSEITHIEEGRYFIDEQRHGPYALWHHEHWFTVLDEKRTEVRDLIYYIPPLGPLGEFVHPLLIAPQLRKIFSHRKAAIAEIFGPAE